MTGIQTAVVASTGLAFALDALATYKWLRHSRRALQEIREQSLLILELRREGNHIVVEERHPDPE